MARRDGNQLTATETLTVQGMASGSYFKENIVPAGTIDGNNAVFTLPATPNPAGSLELKLNGSYLKAGGEDFTLAGDTITFNIAPEVGSVILAAYRVAP